MKDITAGDLVVLLAGGKLEGTVEFEANVLVFSTPEASSLFLDYSDEDKLLLTRLDNERYQISSSSREKRQFRFNFLMEKCAIDYEIRSGEIGMKITLPQRGDIKGFCLALENVRNIRY
jgi:hypothetical protein